MKKRIYYIAAFVILVAIEVVIALFVDDSFIRPYLGDVIVVWAVYAFVRIFLCGKFSPYPVICGVFLFACLVEFLQGINIVGLLGLGGSPFFRTLIGTKADVRDILCYGAGALILAAAVFVCRKISRQNPQKN